MSLWKMDTKTGTIRPQAVWQYAFRRSLLELVEMDLEVIPDEKMDAMLFGKIDKLVLNLYVLHFCIHPWT